MKAVIISLLILVLFGSWLMHEFYLSLTEIRYNPHSERIEISMRIFPDDLDRALLEQTGLSTHLSTELEPPEADSLLWNYISERFTLEINGEEIKINYLGKEPESDAIWCYLESDQVPEPVSVEVYCSLLTETFEDQVNIIQVYQDRWNKGLLLNRDHRSDRLTVGE